MCADPEAPRPMDIDDKDLSVVILDQDYCNPMDYVFTFVDRELWLVCCADAKNAGFFDPDCVGLPWDPGER